MLRKIAGGKIIMATSNLKKKRFTLVKPDNSEGKKTKNPLPGSPHSNYVCNFKLWNQKGNEGIDICKISRDIYRFTN